MSDPAAEIFVEAVLLDVPLYAASQVRPDNLQRLADLPDLRLLRSPKFLNKFDTPTSLNWEQDFGVLEQARLSQVSFIARNAETERPVIELELGFSLPNADPTRDPAIGVTSLVTEANYRAPALAFATHPADSRRELIAIVNTYPIRSAEDRRTLFECKMQLNPRARDGH